MNQHLARILGLFTLLAIVVAAHASDADPGHQDRPTGRRVTLDPATEARIEELALRTSDAMRSANADASISPELERAFVDAWKAGLTREIEFCPSPAQSLPNHPPLYLDDPTLPPQDTLTTWVKVFHDLDESGTFEAGEPGMESIQVANGVAAGGLGPGSVLTGADGTHTFATPLWESRFVFMTVPSGWTATTPFWYRLDEAVDPDSVYFGLTETPETADPVFRFVQMSDPQVGNLVEEGFEHGTDLTEVEGLATTPDFIVITGDLVSTGEHELQFFNYLAGTFGHDTVPIHHGYGDHDGKWTSFNPALEVYHFEKHIGPTYYSFEHGGIHFIMYNDIHAADVDSLNTQWAWLFQDIVTARGRTPDIPFVICKHWMPGQEEITLYNTFQNMLGTFSGHWHGSRVREVQGIFDVNTPPSRYAGIDKASRGFRIIDLDSGQLTTQFREAGIADHLRIVHPAQGDTVVAGAVQLLANAYGSLSVDQTVEYEITGPGYASGVLPMTLEGSWAWTADWSTLGLDTGAYQMTVYVLPDIGAPYQETVDFELMHGGFVVQPDAYSDWPSYKYDAAGIGRRQDDLAPPLRLVWARNLGSPVNVASPTVAGGRVFIGTSNISTTSQARLICLEAATGEILWERETRNDVKSTPAIHGNAVYFTNSTGTAFALDATSGDVLWQEQLGDSLERWEMTSPTYYDGRVYVGGAPAMCALDATTGDVLWQRDGSGTDFIPSTYSAPAVNDEFVVFTNKAGIFVYDRISGDPEWSNTNGSSRVHRSAAIINSVVYTAGPGFNTQRVRIYDLEDGDLQYESGPSLYESTSAPVIGPGPGGEGHRVIIGHGGGGTINNPGRLESYVPPGTNVSWEERLDDLIATSAPYKRVVPGVNSTPAWAGNHVYFGGDDGILYCVDPEIGDAIWSADLGVPIRSSPAVAGNMLFVNTSDGTLYAFVSSFLNSAGTDPAGTQALRTRLIGNWPNPFNPSTTIHFDLGRRERVALKIYDVGGRLVRTLVDHPLDSGRYRYTWDGRSDAGVTAASSVYFYELHAGERTFRRKLVLAK